MNKMEKAKKFVKTHKKEIIISSLVTAGGITLVILGVKKWRGNRDVVTMPGFTIEGGLTVKDLGKLIGEEYLAHDSGLTPDTAVLEVGTLRFE